MNGDSLRLFQHGIGRNLACFVVMLSAPATTWAQADIGQVTLVTGVGESVRWLQPVRNGEALETREHDAFGMMIEETVFHVGPRTKSRVYSEVGQRRLVLEQGFVVIYADPENPVEIIAETPFGKLTVSPELMRQSGTGWYSVRHDPRQPNEPAVSTFATIEGMASVLGVVPEAGPYRLPAGQQWQLVEGQIPGPPEAGDVRTAAEQLRDMLHRRTADFVHADVELVTAEPDAFERGILNEVIAPEFQSLIQVNDVVVENRASVLPPDIDVTLPEFAVRSFPVSPPQVAQANFVGFAGAVSNPNWNDALTDVSDPTGPLPSFSPTYITRMDNAGFSYLQFAGEGATLQTAASGEVFLTSDQASPRGWGFFTPDSAVSTPGFDSQAALVRAVSEGLSAIARAEHLPSQGALTGTGPGDPNAFVTITNGTASISANPPVGYPQLDRAAASNELPAADRPFADQIAAIGSGLDPTTLQAEGGRPLSFLSDSNVDSAANSLDFTGQPINPTALRLPSELTNPQIGLDAQFGSAARPTPLSNQTGNTAGVQFAAQGDVIAVIHHTGQRAPGQTPPTVQGPFQIERGARHSVIRWDPAARPNGADGTPVQLEDLNETDFQAITNTTLQGDLRALRNNLFVTLCREVNAFLPVPTAGSRQVHTVCGPAFEAPTVAAVRSARWTKDRRPPDAGRRTVAERTSRRPQVTATAQPTTRTPGKVGADRQPVRPKRGSR